VTTNWNPADRRTAIAGAQSFVAVLDSRGVMIDQDTDPEEAYARAEHASPSGTVLVDSSVYAAEPAFEDNPSRALARAPQVAVDASKIPVKRIGIDWATFDPISAAGRATVREARERLRARGREIYQGLLEDAAEQVHVRQKRGGVAGDFHASWLVEDFLRQNMKMKKVLETQGSSDSYDSIGLSLLPHGASFREPFATSTDQGPRGATNCLFSTAECRKVCLVNTGQRALESGSFAASYLFSNLLRELPEEFCVNVFDRCIQAFDRAKAEGFYRFIRLNVLSDLPWELIAPGLLESISERARTFLLRKRGWSWTKGMAFYDYTKIPYRPGVPNYYDLTFSFAGSRGLYEAFFDVLEGRAGSATRSAVVFVQREQDAVRGTGVPYRAAPGKPLMSKDRLYHPWRFMGEKVWNGDLSDIRPLDPPEVKIVGLAYKVARYKVAAPPRSKKKFGLVNIVPTTELDAELPTFLVRVMQPDPEAPPIVVATQDLDNRKLVFPGWGDPDVDVEPFLL
jgi:hypothetical protein